MTTLSAVRLEGGLLSFDTVEQILRGELPGQQPADFGLDRSRSLTDEIAAVLADSRRLWEVFQHRLQRLSSQDLATSDTREWWVIPLLRLLGYAPHFNAQAYWSDNMSFAISHRMDEPADAPPVHIVGIRQELGRLAPSGRPRLSPHALVQEYLNRTEHLWGIVTNGHVLRLLRDSTFVRRQAYIEFDLRAIVEEQLFTDFALLYRLIHRSRFPRGIADAHECYLERYYRHAEEQGGRVREHLRDGVERCIELLANGFLRHPANQELRDRVRGDGSAPPLAPQDLYRQLLRLIYRFLFLLVAEERGLLRADALYHDHYGIARLRRLVDLPAATDDYDDLWQSLRVLWKVLTTEEYAALLGVPVLNGELFHDQDLDACTIANRDLLAAFRHLVYYRDEVGRRPYRVNYAALDVEELGSVYESLLDYHPQMDCSGAIPVFHLGHGSERKTTGSYYTPPELVQELLQSALEPVLRARLEEARRMAHGEWQAVNREWRMVEQLFKEWLNAERQRLQGPGGVEASNVHRQGHLPAYRTPAEGGELRADQPAPSRSSLDPREHRGGMGTSLHSGIHSIPSPSQREPDGAGDAPAHQRAGETPASGSDVGTLGHSTATGQAAHVVGTQPPTAEELAVMWSQTPFAIRYWLLAQAAILSLRVVDPACGSGHFLLAAARRLGKELARIRTGEDEPAPEHIRAATRDVITHCIYGVDKNPLAVELCKVALWIESNTGDKPLTFLDHRIRCGDSLVGVLDLAVLSKGIPDDAFEPVAGDDKSIARGLAKGNRQQRGGQYVLPFDAPAALNALSALRHQMDAIPDDSPAHIREKQQCFEESRSTAEWRRAATAAHLWTAAFFQGLQPGKTAITTAAVVSVLQGNAPAPTVHAAAEEIALRQRFFHWHLEFPEVFAEGGFDVVLGNPPFMGGLKISGALGTKYRHWLESTFAPFGGTADLCAAFFRRAFDLLKPGGRLGMVATNTIGQGDTRESGLA
ncbi:MAG: N-6 DNA methylase, partial [Fimbriimonadales bacterium]|nr:N-6 DNA methylase [Fimbriimonadales bacterium]